MKMFAINFVLKIRIIIVKNVGEKIEPSIFKLYLKPKLFFFLVLKKKKISIKTI